MSEVKTERRRPDTVVTSENLAAYQDREFARLAPIPVETAKAKESAKSDPEATKSDEKAKTETADPDKTVKQEKVEEVKADDKLEAKKDESKPQDKNDKKQSDEEDRKQSKLSERMHELAERAKKAEKAREELERRLTEAEAKLNPPATKTEEFQKPKKEDFPDDPDKFAEKLAEWAAKKAVADHEKAQAEERAKAQRERVQATWMDRISAIKQEVPDFVEKIQKSEVAFSDEMRDAIMESEVGPRILLHFAENPQEAEKINRLTLGKAYIALGKLEAILSAPTKVSKKETEEEPEKVPAKPFKQVEVSKAPEPITPLKGALAPVDLPIIDGVWKGTHEQYREARRSGKIK